MKKITFVLAATAVLFASCDKISEQEYKGGKQGTIIEDEGFLWHDSQAAVKTVLIEDFTGQTCGNCPAASVIAADLKEDNPGRVVVMEVHAGFFAEPYPAGAKYRTDYRNATSLAIEGVFGVSAVGNPNGMINRMDFPTTQHVKNITTWGSLVNAKLAEAPIAKLHLETEYDSTKRAITVMTTARFVADYAEGTSLVIYLTEDSLVDWQKDYRLPSGEQDVQYFAHRHVLRDALNTPFGTVLTTAPVVAGKGLGILLDYTLPTNYVDKHCALVGVLYNTTTKEVIQVEEVHLIE